jgi:hypothetical protein
MPIAVGQVEADMARVTREVLAEFQRQADGYPKEMVGTSR